jgi:hypothetical protein
MVDTPVDEPARGYARRMTGLRRVLAELAERLRAERYRAQQQHRALDEQRYEDRKARHDAGIFEPPRGGI